VLIYYYVIDILRQTDCLIRIQWIWGVEQKKQGDFTTPVPPTTQQQQQQQQQQ
jgi:hypothetical protein